MGDSSFELHSPGLQRLIEVYIMYQAPVLIFFFFLIENPLEEVFCMC